MGILGSKQQQNIKKPQPRHPQSLMLKTESNILNAINKNREKIYKLKWNVNYENLYYAYLKIRINQQYLHMRRENIEYIICEFYTLQKKNRTQRKFNSLFETYYQNKDQVQIRLPKNIPPGVQLQCVLYFIFPNNHLYEIDSKFFLKKRFQNIPQIELIEKKDNNLIAQQLLNKVDQIKQSGYKVNILVVGKIGVGKSSFIQHTITIFERYFKKNEKLQKPFICTKESTVTKNFNIYQFKQQGIRLIDTPGYGGQVGLWKTQDFINEYKEIYKIGLTGNLNYDKYDLPDCVSIKSNKQLMIKRYDYDKIIHFVLILTDLNTTGIQIEVNKYLIEQCLHRQINYALIVNKIDLLVQYEYSGSTYARILQNLENSGYNIDNYENIFPLSLKKNEIQNSEACQFLYLSVLKKTLQNAFSKVREYTIVLDYQQNPTQTKIWRLQEDMKELRDVLNRHFPGRILQQIEMKINDEWTSVNSIEIYLKNLRNFVKYNTEKKKYLVQLRDKKWADFKS